MLNIYISVLNIILREYEESSGVFFRLFLSFFYNIFWFWTLSLDYNKCTLEYCKFMLIFWSRHTTFWSHNNTFQRLKFTIDNNKFMNKAMWEIERERETTKNTPSTTQYTFNHLIFSLIMFTKWMSNTYAQIYFL